MTHTHTPPTHTLPTRTRTPPSEIRSYTSMPTLTDLPHGTDDLINGLHDDEDDEDDDGEVGGRGQRTSPGQRQRGRNGGR